MAGTLTVTEEGQTIQLNIAAVGQAGASDVSKLTAAGMSAGSYLRVTASEGLEERTAEEVLGDIPLLVDGVIDDTYFPDQLPIDYLVLEDTTGSVLDDGALGLDSDGLLVLHDGVTSGGQQVVAESPYRMRGSRILAQVADGLDEDTITDLDSFPISAVQAAEGDFGTLEGRIDVAFVGTKPTSAAIGIVPPLGAAEALLKNVIGVDLSAASVSLYKCSVVIDLAIATNALVLGSYDGRSVETRLTGSTTSLSLENAPDVAGSGAELISLGVAQEIKLQLHLSGQENLAGIYVLWDLLYTPEPA